MRQTGSTYKQGGVALFIPPNGYGIRFEPLTPYQYPKGHPCEGCPFTMQATVASCMFPARESGGCFRYECNRQPNLELPDCNQQAAQKINDFIEILEAVKRRKGYQ